jgi:hypothetical protein
VIVDAGTNVVDAIIPERARASSLSPLLQANLPAKAASSPQAACAAFRFTSPLTHAVPIDALARKRQSALAQVKGFRLP